MREWNDLTEIEVSIPHMGCMPYGPLMAIMPYGDPLWFQSLIWVACPTGPPAPTRECIVFAIGFNPSYGLHALRAMAIMPYGDHPNQVSIPHMGCMPYGPWMEFQYVVDHNVSIPHMGCMPYGLGAAGDDAPDLGVSIPHMGCMPYGPFAAVQGIHVIQVSIPHMGCMPYGLSTVIR